MNRETIQKLVDVASRVGYMFIVTADEKGLPHLAVARRFNVVSERHIMVADWFCPKTSENLSVNLHVACVAWDAELDVGYQAFGVLQDAEEIAMLDEFVEEAPEIIPQAEKQLTIRLDDMVSFSQVVHSDKPEA